MDRFEEQPEPKPGANVEAQTQPSRLRRESPDDGSAPKNQSRGPNRESAEWSRLEQKLLFALLSKRPSSWQSHTACFVNRSRAEAVDFVQKSFDKIKRDEAISVLERVKHAPDPKGRDAHSASSARETDKLGCSAALTDRIWGAAFAARKNLHLRFETECF